MKLHSRKLLRKEQVTECLNAAKRNGTIPRDIEFYQFEREGSRSRRNGWLIQLSTRDRFSRADGRLRHRKQNATYDYVASHDEWGWFIAEIFAVDPDAIFGDYTSAKNFHLITRGKYGREGMIPMGAVDPIDLQAEGISEERYMACLRAIVSEFNQIRDEKHWCWVWLKFGTAVHPLIVQGVRAGTDSNHLRLNVPEPEERFPQEWFNDLGWKRYNKSDTDAARMEELRKTYGRMLKIVVDTAANDARRQVTMDDVQRVFRTSGLPKYVPGAQAWKGYVSLRVVEELTLDDYTATKAEVDAAWKEFTAKVGWKGGEQPTFQSYGNDTIKPRDADLIPFLGNPNSNYDPMVMPDGRRLSNAA